MKKRLLALLLAMLMILTFAACAKEDKGGDEGPAVAGKEVSDDVTVRVATLGGSTAVGMAKLINDVKEKTAVGDYAIEIVGTDPTEVIAGIQTGKYDVAALPVNVAAKLYGLTKGKVKVIALNTLGVLHVLERGEQTVCSVKDLKGKTVYTTGEGATPQYILEYILEKNGLQVGEDVNVSYEADAQAAVAAMGNGTASICMLPEPMATAITKQIPDVTRVLDMTAEWNKVCDTDVVQGCIIATEEFVTKHKGQLDQFLAEYKASVEYVAGNPEQASLLVEKAGIIASAAIAKLAIPGCNLVYIDGTEMKATLSEFLTILHTAEPASVGGKLPDDAFYYQK